MSEGNRQRRDVSATRDCSHRRRPSFVVMFMLLVMLPAAVLAACSSAGPPSHRGQVTPGQGGSIALAGARLSVPPGSVSGSGYLRATAVGAPPQVARTTNMSGSARLSGVSTPVHFAVTGARVIRPVRLMVRVRPFALPSGLPEATQTSAAWLSYYDSATRRWQPVASRYNPSTGFVTAEVSHLSWWMAWTWDWSGIALRLRQALSFLGSGRASPTSCPSIPAVTVTSVGGQDPPLIGCAAKAGSDTLSISLTNNRGLSVVVSGVPSEAAQDSLSYRGFDGYIASLSATTHLLGGADLPPGQSLTYSLPLHGPPAVFTAAPTLGSYTLDLASIIGQNLAGLAKYGQVNAGYAS